MLAGPGSNYVLQRTPGTFYVSTYHRGPAPLNTALGCMPHDTPPLLFESRREPFSCPRCLEHFKFALAGSAQLKNYRLCAGCGSLFRVKGGLMHALVLTLAAATPAMALLATVLAPLTRSGVLKPLVVLAILTAVSFAVLQLLRGPLARRLVRLEYLGKHAP